ncbi:MAG: indole-3-glycerol-phosphate synthase [Spirochaetes bacterium]|nr:indole-3-glycerol-phosphate synthase [Spirochaetota bacterium]
MARLHEFELSKMRELKEIELPGLRNLLQRCIPRQKPIYRLRKNEIENGIIAEIKCASPSKGIIRKVDSKFQAQGYVRGGAIAISVLTDCNFFDGSWSNLYQVAHSVPVPVLCKEFIFFEEQINVAWMLGADMVLLIARMLDKKELRNLYEHALVRGMVPLVEVHHSEELSKVLPLNPSHLIINSRDLGTLRIEYEVAKKTWKKLPSKIVKIWASGIHSVEDIKKIKYEVGAQYFLVGTAFMESDNPEEIVREMSGVR